MKSMCPASRAIFRKSQALWRPRTIGAHRRIARHGHFDDLAKSMCPRPRASFTDFTDPPFCVCPKKGPNFTDRPALTHALVCVSHISLKEASSMHVYILRTSTLYEY